MPKKYYTKICFIFWYVTAIMIAYFENIVCAAQATIATSLAGLAVKSTFP